MHTSARVDVFLHEGLIDDAIKVVQESSGYGLLEQVMDAAIGHRPDWVITAATAQAERIIDAGQAALVIVGESKLQEAVEKAGLKAEKHVAKELDTSARDIDKEVREAASEVS